MNTPIHTTNSGDVSLSCYMFIKSFFAIPIGSIPETFCHFLGNQCQRDKFIEGSEIVLLFLLKSVILIRQFSRKSEKAKQKAVMIQRAFDLDQIKKLTTIFPVTAILGPRQCGKTTLSWQLRSEHYFDLENPRDLSKLENPQIVLESLQGTVVIDEVQRKPDLFPLLRYLVDHHSDQKYIILGSASRLLTRQSSETLAGRIGYYQLEGFGLNDVGESHWRKLWFQGGYPRSFLAEEADSGIWRDQYITTFLERDIPQLGITIPAQTLRRFWMMLSHYHGATLNYSELAQSFGMSHQTIKRYLDILESTLMVRLLMPWFNNTSKRLVKAPKLYLTDSGIFHALQYIDRSDQLLAHPKLGASWEGFAISVLSRALRKRNEEVFFWGTHAGAELDLCWQNQGRFWGAEFKFKDTPKVTKSMRIALQDLELAHLWVIYPGPDSYPLDDKISVLALKDISSTFIPHFPFTYSSSNGSSPSKTHAQN